MAQTGIVYRKLETLKDSAQELFNEIEANDELNTISGMLEDFIAEAQKLHGVVVDANEVLARL